MKINFKFAALALAEAVAIFSLAACGGGGEGQNDTGNEVMASPEMATAASTDEIRHANAAGNVTWKFLVGENSSFTVPVNSTVRYGVDDKWIEKAVSGAGVCSNQFFGSDPRPNKFKSCYIAVSAPTSAAGTARVFYSDLDSGPNTGGLNNNGVMVTLSGKGFGATRGTSTVKVGGGTVATYVSWSDTKVVVQLGAAAKTGDITIVNGAGEASNGVPFSVREGPIYYVSPTGTGTGTFSNPMPPSAIYSRIVPGATFYMFHGVYSGEYGATYNRNNFVLGSSKGGAPGKPVAFVGYPGEVVVLDSTKQAPGFDNLEAWEQWSGMRGAFLLMDDDWRPTDPRHNADYVTISNLRMQCHFYCISAGTTADSRAVLQKLQTGAKNVRVVNNVLSADYGTVGKVSNTATGMLAIGANGWRVYGNELKDTGGREGGVPVKNNHGIYVQAGASDVDIGWNYAHNLVMGHVIQVHMDTEPGAAYTFKDVRIHDNVLTAANPTDSRGIVVGRASSDSYGSIYNNVISNAGGDFSAVAIYSGDWNISNNTFHNIKAPGMVWLQTSGGNSQADAHTRVPTAVITNNIFYSDGVSPYFMMGDGTATSQMKTSNNLYFNKGAAPSFDTAPVNANPLFVNATAGNFHLQSTSPAIGKGSSSLSAVVKTDADGIKRALKGSFDIGAFEYTAP